MKVSMSPRFQAAVCVSRTARICASSEESAVATMEEREITARQIVMATVASKAMRNLADIWCSSTGGSERTGAKSRRDAGATEFLRAQAINECGAGQHLTFGSTVRQLVCPLGGTFVGTDVLLRRAGRNGRMGEVEHVYISVHSRDLLGSDGAVRLV